MPFLGLCDGDPLVKTLREVFGTNIVRVPEERIQPLSVVASNGKKTSFQGALQYLLIDNTPLNLNPADSSMAELSGKRSRTVETGLGLKILDGFLKGFNLPAGEIASKFSGASQVSFSFNDVKRNYVDINQLGNSLTGRIVNKNNPAAAIFFQKKGSYSLLVIDSTIRSSDFNIRVDKSKGQGFKLDIPVIQTIVTGANAGVKVESHSEYDLTFRGNKHLAFAFSCVRLYLQGNGTISSMPPEPNVPALGRKLSKLQKPSHVVRYSPDRILLNKTAGLLSWDKVG